MQYTGSIKLISGYKNVIYTKHPILKVDYKLRCKEKDRGRERERDRVFNFGL